MRNTSLIEYALIAVLAVCMVGLLASALAPTVKTFAHLGNVISSALAGTK